MTIIDRSHEVSADLSKIDKSTAQWVYADIIKPRGDYYQKDRQQHSPRGYRPPWTPKTRRAVPSPGTAGVPAVATAEVTS